MKMTKKVAKEIMTEVLSGLNEKVIDIRVIDEDSAICLSLDTAGTVNEYMILKNICYVSRQMLSSVMVHNRHDMSQYVNWEKYN